VTLGGLGGGGFRVSFGLVKEIVVWGPSSPRRARLRELVARRGGLRARGAVAGGAPDYSQARAAYVSERACRERGSGSDIPRERDVREGSPVVGDAARLQATFPYVLAICLPAASK